MWLTLAYVLVFVYGGGGVTQSSGISKFWTDDYKVFEQVYGKTSDRELYGATLPASVSHVPDSSKKKAAAAASEKKERFIDAQPLPYYDSLADRYTTQNTKLPDLTQPAVSTYNFVSYSDFKPISQQSDPETYNYLKHLEQYNNEHQYNNEQNIDFPKGIGGFKPYLTYVGGKPDDTEAYKSIQDILDAHRGTKVSKTTKSKQKELADGADKNLNYDTYIPTSVRKRKTPKSGKRKRYRPYIRKIKRIVRY